LARHDELLQEAKHLASREPAQPRQISLRQAVSAAYYALFHALIAEAVTVLAPSLSNDLGEQIGRAFNHADMKRVCNAFSSGHLPPATKALVAAPVGEEIKWVAETFAELQEARYKADYDTAAIFSDAEVMTKITAVEQSFGRLASVRGQPDSHVFLVALLLQRH
jgi:hypothetical protein